MGSSAAVLPVAWVSFVWLRFAWFVVLLVIGLWVLCKWSAKARLSWVLISFLLVVFPGDYSAVFQLGMAFQSPSSLAVLVWLPMALRRSGSSSVQSGKYSFAWIFPLAGVILGWLLFLDTFALLPVQMHAWGFGSHAFWLLCGISAVAFAFGCYELILVSLLFAALHLPTGNVWDALMDPLFWIWLHWRLFFALKKPLMTK